MLILILPDEFPNISGHIETSCLTFAILETANFGGYF
jgi:hypothetical protein